MRGRKPAPTHLKLVRGNPAKRPLNRREPKPDGDLHEAPDWLSEAQKVGWAYTIAHAPIGLLKKLDRSALTVWVVAEDLHRQAVQKVTEYGLITKSPKQGEPVQNPYLPIINKQAAIMLKAASELGFTPASRSRISLAPEANDDDPFATYLQRIGQAPT